MTELESQHQEQLTQPKAGKGKKIDQLELEHLARVEAGLELMRGMRSLFLNLIAEPIGPRTDTAT